MESELRGVALVASGEGLDREIDRCSWVCIYLLLVPPTFVPAAESSLFPKLADTERGEEREGEREKDRHNESTSISSCSVTLTSPGSCTRGTGVTFAVMLAFKNRKWTRGPCFLLGVMTLPEPITHTGFTNRASYGDVIFNRYK